MDEVVTPPFDVISPEEQEAYHRRHPYNMIRLILGKQKPGDDENHNWYTRAAATLAAWRKEGVLIRDFKPALYYYEIDYQDVSDGFQTRKGIICLVRLRDFSHGSVLPHERTYEVTKSERLELMLACNANLSQVFALYSDPTQRVTHILSQERDHGEVFRFMDNAGIRHRMWRVTREPAIHKIREYMREKPLFIADGHHRYETALNYQRLMQHRYPERGERASFNYVLMYLANMHQKGLSILPSHRMFVHLPQFNLETFLGRAAQYFAVERFPFNATNRSEVQSEFLHYLYSAGEHQSIGMYESGADQFVLLKMREDVNHKCWRAKLPEPLQHLDVVVLTELVFKQLLNIDEKTLNDETGISYRHNAVNAIEQVDRNQFQLAFLLNHPKIEHLQEVARSGLFMPHKSTYFYPKVIDGTVLNLLDPSEDVVL
jgi:uncharacterized protein (DUF1015 family)